MAGIAEAQSVGGGWVNDSEPDAEFQETVNKSKAVFPHDPHPAYGHPLPLPWARDSGTGRDV